MPTTTQIGQNGEQIVLDYYIANGWTLIAKNFNYYQKEKIGEIDLIMLKNNRLYLVEVKTRKDQSFAMVLEQITRKKLQCIYKSYQGFLCRFPYYKNSFVQLDVATVVGDGNEVKVYSNCYSFEGF